MQLVNLAFSLALPSAGRSKLAKIAMMAITTNNSINVKPCCLRFIFISNVRNTNPKVCPPDEAVNPEKGAKRKDDPL